MSLTPVPAPWVLEAHRDLPVYTRPLIGSELACQKYEYDNDGECAVCIGMIFTSSFGIKALKARAREALDKLRFVSPIIACNVENVDSSLRWVYTPSGIREAWLDRAFMVEERGQSLNPQQFIDSIIAKRLPYVFEDGITTSFRAYLLTTSHAEDGQDNEYALYLHGPHAMMDATPTWHALNLMCEWMSGEGMEIDVVHSEEWRNLPVDPLTATGGPAKEWMTDGMKLLLDVKENTARTSTEVTMDPPPGPCSTSETPFLCHRTLPKSVVAAILAKTKQLGISMSMLFQAAFCLAKHSLNPMPEGSDIDFSPDMIPVSLEPYFKPPLNPKTHLLSCISVMPTRFSITEALKERVERDRLIMIAMLLRDQFEKYLTNPCLPQLLCVLMHLMPSPEVVTKQTPDSDVADPATCEEKLPMKSATLQNLGVVDRKLRPHHKNITVRNISFEVTVRTILSCHVWTWDSKLYTQVKAASIWGQEFTNKIAEEMERIALLILDEPPV